MVVSCLNAYSTGLDYVSVHVLIAYLYHLQAKSLFSDKTTTVVMPGSRYVCMEKCSIIKVQHTSRGCIIIIHVHNPPTEYFILCVFCLSCHFVLLCLQITLYYCSKTLQRYYLYTHDCIMRICSTLYSLWIVY